MKVRYQHDLSHYALLIFKKFPFTDQKLLVNCNEKEDKPKSYGSSSTSNINDNELVKKYLKKN